MCKSQWRLPTKEELIEACENKVDGFESYYYWSSDTVEDNSDDAWFVHFYSGCDFWHSKFNDRYVRLVRGDKVLEWNKDVEHMTWHKAQDYIREMNGDSNEWRLPTKDELLKAYEDRTGGFSSSYYWSSDTAKGRSNYAWYVHFRYGSDNWYTKGSVYHVRLVRDSDKDKLEWSKESKIMSWYDAQNYVKKMNGDSNE